MKAINRLSLSHQFVGVTLALVSLVILALALFVSSLHLPQQPGPDQQRPQAAGPGVRKMIDTTHEISVSLTDKVATLFISQFPEPSRCTPTAPCRSGPLEAPTLEYRSKALNLDFTAVDELTRSTGGVATISSAKGRLHPGEHLLKNERASAPSAPASAPTTRPAPGSSPATPYLASAKLFGRHYMTKYVPARDRDSKGRRRAVHRFRPDPGFASLKNHHRRTQVRRTGYAYVFHSQGQGAA